MITADQVQTLKDIVPSAQTILVLLPPLAKFDHVATAATLVLGLQAQGKNVFLASPDPLLPETQVLKGTDQVLLQLGNKNLQVSFPYQEALVDKVSYNIDEEKQLFHLVIQPKRGEKPLDSSSVKFAYTGVETDLIFTIGVNSLEMLDQLYQGYEELFTQTTVVSLNSYETEFGNIKLNIAGTASYSEVAAFLLQELGVELTADLATNLLAGIEMATDNFRSLAASAETFEITSKLLRLGGHRIPKPMAPVRTSNSFVEAFARGSKNNPPPKSSLASASAKPNGVMSRPETEAEENGTKNKLKKPVKKIEEPPHFPMEGSGGRG